MRQQQSEAGGARLVRGTRTFCELVVCCADILALLRRKQTANVAVERLRKNAALVGNP
jgi:hypothetical protein